jgi:hypothetical protein
MSRSHRANHYGTLAERQLASRYGIELARASWKDGDRDGHPVEMKSTMHRHADGQPGNFKIYEAYHRKLRRAGGYYALAVYRVRGRGIELVRTKYVHSSQLPRLSWHGGGDHRGTRQAKLAIEDVF